jgi:hypothetical protein
VANGAPIGQQRLRALAAARNYLSAGHSVEDTARDLARLPAVTPGPRPRTLDFRGCPRHRGRPGFEGSPTSTTA